MTDPLHSRSRVVDKLEVDTAPLVEEAAAAAVQATVTSSSCPWRDGLAETCWLALILFYGS
jgi:hypothetical protein